MITGSRPDGSVLGRYSAPQISVGAEVMTSGSVQNPVLQSPVPVLHVPEAHARLALQGALMQVPVEHVEVQVAGVNL